HVNNSSGKLTQDSNNSSIESPLSSPTKDIKVELEKETKSPGNKNFKSINYTIRKLTINMEFRSRKIN
ncbi:14788_t:CDS:1, partial [Funneliformis caledonium]